MCQPHRLHHVACHASIPMLPASSPKRDSDRGAGREDRHRHIEIQRDEDKSKRERERRGERLREKQERKADHSTKVLQPFASNY